MTACFRRSFVLLCLLFISVVSRAVTASFTADYTSGCSPLVVHFTNTSTGATSYLWNFGTSTTSVLANPSTSFTAPGTYTVLLTATGSGGTDTQTMVITVYPAPTVAFSVPDTTICPGTTVAFSNTTVLGTAGAGTYLWNFGDGFNSTTAAPTHTYNTPGSYNVTLSVTNSQGCISTLTKTAYIRVFPHSTVNFSSATTTYCSPPQNVTFVNTTTGVGPLSYNWDFGDGGTSTLTSPTHTYTATGVYTVRLIVTDGNGCSDTLTRVNYITIATLNADFIPVASGCVGNTITFYNASGPHITSAWNFGDGGTSSTDTGRHVYTTPGTYTVRLVISTPPCRDTVYYPITINPQPTGTITVTPAVPCPAPVAMTYTGSVAAGSSISWIFSDGSTASGSPVTHTVASSGYDTTYMLVQDVNGCRDTFKYVDTFYNVTFRIVDDTILDGCVPLTMTFRSELVSLLGTPTAPYTILTYNWVFGDGSATSTAAIPSHTYTAVGTYTVTCTITTANGCTFVDTALVYVGSPPVISVVASPTHVCYSEIVTFFTTVVSGPVDYYIWNWADSTGSTVSYSTIEMHNHFIPGVFIETVTPIYHGCAGAPVLVGPIIVDSPKARIRVKYNCNPRNSVTVINESYGATSHTIFFGDATSSTADSVVHLYPALTVYTITLTTYNAASGCRDTIIAVINLAPPTPAIFTSDTTICLGDSLTFYRVVSGGTALRDFWFVEGVNVNNDTGATLRYRFDSSGLFTIMYYMKDIQNCFDTVIKTNWITVGKPVDSFVATPLFGCGPLVVNFTSYTAAAEGTSIASHTWNFGDGGVSTVTGATTSHTYVDGGVYSVVSIATDNIGCKDTFVRPNYITVWRPNANFTASNTHPCINQSITFTNTTTGGVSYSWDFGDGSPAETTTSPSHIYTNVGSYNVRLVAVDVHGCTDTMLQVGYIQVTKPTAAFTMSDSFTICPPLMVNFTNTTVGGVSYLWQFSEGGTSSIVSPSNLYTSSGVYTVTLIATNTWGCTDTVSHNVTLYGYAGALTYGPLTGCSPVTVTFHADLTNIPSVIWDFSDGTTSTASTADSAVHTYVLPGAYIPKLILSDGTGCQNSSIGIDTIKINDVIAGFTTVPNPVCVTVPFTFTDTSKDYFSTVTSWNWTFSDGSTATTPTASFVYNTVGTYPVTLRVVDGWGCTDSITTTVKVNPPPTITTSPDTTVCVGDAATLTAYGASTYVWTPSATVSSPTANPTFASPTTETLYTVTGTDTNGCVNTDTVRVLLRTHTFSGAWGDTAVCRYEPVPLYDTGGNKYTWIPAAGLNNSTIANPTATPDATTTYTVIAQLGSCIPDTSTVTVIVHQLPTVDAGPNQTILAGTQAQLEATGTLIDKYLWSPPNFLSCETCGNPISTPSYSQTYTVTVTSDFGCKAYDTVRVNVYCDVSQIFIPNTFTPNGDGHNDVFYPRGGGVSIIKTFRIFNRWGELLFERTNFNINDKSNAWDGTYNANPPRPDVYVYLLDAVCDTGEPLFLKGDVTIVR